MGGIMKYLIATATAVVVALVAMFACAGCGHNTQNAHNTQKTDNPARNKQQIASTSTAYPRFSLPAIPAAVPPEQQREWLREHFWDGFRFADSAYVAAQDTAAMIRCFAIYAVQAVGQDDPSHIARLMQRAEASTLSRQYFAFLAERVLHDPNSPLRNDELYIPVLESVLASPQADSTEKIVARHDLRMARQNRVGHTANDFKFTDIHGHSSSLGSVKAPFVLLFFSNPGCLMCAQTAQALGQSEVITRAVKQNRLKIIMIYPDDDLEAWRNHAAEIPSQWLYVRDAEHEIRDRMLYDLKAIPALYLLDQAKRVVVKDAAEIGPVEQCLATASADSQNL